MKKPELKKYTPPLSHKSAPVRLGPLKPKLPLPQFILPPDPIGDIPAGELVEELGALGQGFKARMKEENNRKTNATDGNYYFVVAFSSCEQKESFLRGIKFPVDTEFMDGRDLAERLSVAILPDTPSGKLGRIPPDLAAMSLEKDQR